MSFASIEMLELAARVLADLLDGDLVFVGGQTVGLWGTYRAASDFWPTDDGDLIVEASSRADY